MGKRAKKGNTVTRSEGLLPRVWEKVRKRPAWQYEAGAHSHVCGKKQKIIKNFLVDIGTLPLAWEKASKLWNVPIIIGITPTRVGKSHAAASATVNGRDHSHSRGKKT